ncbi:hypothetical protein INR49_012805 [Caranx melampygus]|nr:hypothetical protein INR49_012805 [Caranx melampygus]
MDSPTLPHSYHLTCLKLIRPLLWAGLDWTYWFWGLTEARGSLFKSQPPFFHICDFQDVAWPADGEVRKANLQGQSQPSSESVSVVTSQAVAARVPGMASDQQTFCYRQGGSGLGQAGPRWVRKDKAPDI